MNTLSLIRFSLLITLSFVINACQLVSTPDFQPKLQQQAAKEKLQTLSSPFNPLSKEELSTDWAKEYKIGIAFAKKFDFYRALTGLERALILGEDDVISNERKQQIYYDIFLCYFWAGKYEEAIYTFEKTPLANVSPKSFKAFQDLLMLLEESYQQIGENEKAKKALSILKAPSPVLHEKISMKTSWQQADLPQISTLYSNNEKWEYFPSIVENFEKEKKSIKKAQWLNAAIPGAGYYYVGQKKTATTALLLNTLFIGAACQAFSTGQPFLGAILTSFELGWYIGGINGAGIAANDYNENIFEKHGNKVLQQEKLLPLFFIEWGF
jgi:tetratricopeptide (TPR) repeat protein